MESNEEWNKGFELFYESEYEKALEVFERMNQTQPNDALIEFALGLVYGNLNQLDKRQHFFRESLQTDPTNKFSYLCQALFRCATNDYNEALRFIDQFLNNEPDFDVALCCKGYCLNSLQRFSESIECLRRCIDRRPKYSSAHTNIAIAFYQTSYFDQSLVHFEAARLLTPSDASTWTNSGVALRQIGKHSLALSYFDCAIRLDPSDKRLYLLKYRTMFLRDAVDQTIVCFDEITDEQPQIVLEVMNSLVKENCTTSSRQAEDRLLSVVMHRTRGRSLMNLRRFSEAIGEFHIAKTLSFSQNTQNLLETCIALLAAHKRAVRILQTSVMHFLYKPGGPGFLSARSHFFSLSSSFIPSPSVPSELL
jgi:tetratricopeptide (TPR) repeat protein